MLREMCTHVAIRKYTEGTGRWFKLKSYLIYPIITASQKYPMIVIIAQQ